VHPVRDLNPHGINILFCVPLQPRSRNAVRKRAHADALPVAPDPTTLRIQEDLIIEDEHLLEELAPLKEALERAVHRKNEATSLKEHFEDEVRTVASIDTCNQSLHIIHCISLLMIGMAGTMLCRGMAQRRRRPPGVRQQPPQLSDGEG